MRIQHFYTIMLVKFRSWRHCRRGVLFHIAFVVASGNEFILLKSFNFKLIKQGSNTCLTFGSFFFPQVVFGRFDL